MVLRGKVKDESNLQTREGSRLGFSLPNFEVKHPTSGRMIKFWLALVES